MLKWEAEKAEYEYEREKMRKWEAEKAEYEYEREKGANGRPKKLSMNTRGLKSTDPGPRLTHLSTTSRNSMPKRNGLKMVGANQAPSAKSVQSMVAAVGGFVCVCCMTLTANITPAITISVGIGLPPVNAGNVDIASVPSYTNSSEQRFIVIL